MSVSYLSQIVLEHYIMSCCCFTRLTVGERKATWSEVISYDWRSIFINAAVGILITAFSTLSKIFLYSEGTKVLCFLFFLGGFFVFFFYLCAELFSFPNLPCCDCTQTDNKSQMSCELKAADERGREELIHFLWQHTAYCFMCTTFKYRGWW